MKTRSSFVILGLGLGGCLILVVCAVAISIGSYFLFTRSDLFSANSVRPLNRVLVVGQDLNLSLFDPTTGKKTGLTTDGDGGVSHGNIFPTWSPDDRHIAYVHLDYSGGSATGASLESISPSGDNRTVLYKSDSNLPFYLYWSPDSHNVGFLTSISQTDLALEVANGDKADSVQELEKGSPLYWAWSPDGKRMLLHVGGARSDSVEARVSLLPFGQKNSAKQLKTDPGSFQTPQWSPDGKHILFSTQAADHSESLALADAQGDNSKVLVNYSGRISFAWSASGDRIAYVVTDPSTQLPTFGHVMVIGTDGQNARDISGEDTVAFFWSPNGKRLAYLSIKTTPSNSSYRFVGPAQTGQTSLELVWKIEDLGTNETREVAIVEPTDTFVNMLPFFEQYSLSMTFWSPDSNSFVYTSKSGSSAGSVWVADVTGKKSPKNLGDGLVAFWSWK